MNPANAADVGGVLDLLADDAWRKDHKLHMGLTDDNSGLPVWGVLDNWCYVTFVEYEVGGRVGVVTVNRTSKMRPSTWGPWL